MRVLRSKDPCKRIRERLLAGGPALQDLLPEEVAELLGRIRMSARDLQDLLDPVVADSTVGLVEPLLDERSEHLRRDNAELGLFRTPPEGLVLVVEDAFHHASLTT